MGEKYKVMGCVARIFHVADIFILFLALGVLIWVGCQYIKLGYYNVAVSIGAVIASIFISGLRDALVKLFTCWSAVGWLGPRQHKPERKRIPAAA